MREFLLELYLEYGEREFNMHGEVSRNLYNLGYAVWISTDLMCNKMKLTLKALNYLKQNDS